MMICGVACADRVYLMIGQSNMSGLGSYADLADPNSTLRSYSAPLERVSIYQMPGFGVGRCESPLVPGRNGNMVTSEVILGSQISKSQFGPEVSLGKFLMARFPKERIHLIKVNFSGTCLSEGTGSCSTDGVGVWNDPNSAIYQALVRIWTSATQENQIMKSCAGFPVLKLDGIFWMQGEGDGTDQGAAPKYAVSLGQFVAKIRAITGSPNAKFVFGMIQNRSGSWYSGAYNSPIWQYGDVIQAQQRLAEQVIQNSRLVLRSADLSVWTPRFDWSTDWKSQTCDLKNPVTMNCDAAHYDSRGQIILGELFGNAMAGMPPSRSVPASFPF